MTKLSTEDYNKELVTLKTNFEKFGLSNVSDDFINKMMESSSSVNEESGSSYPGSLVVHINLICAIASKLAKMISGTFQISEASIYKVCICQQLSKMDMFVPNDNDWEIQKRGLNYKFAVLPGRLKFGERSIMKAIYELGVNFTAEEWEAMECLDKDGEEKGSKYYDTILTTVIRQANELAVAIEKERYNKKNN